MEPNVIAVRGARSNNLVDVDVDIPRGRLVVVVGVSGSGKSSLVFDTLAAEAGFQLNETFPPFVRNRLPKWSQPDVDHLSGLSPVVVIDQRRISGNARSTVGTITDTWTYLRLIFSRLSEPHVGDSNRLSFNDPAGMCPTCSGLGEVVVTAVDRFLDPDKSLEDGALLAPGFGTGGYWFDQYADIGVFERNTPLRDWTEEQRHALLYGGAAAAALGDRPPDDYEGVVERFERINLQTADNLSDRKKQTIEQFTRSDLCPECAGARLNEVSRTATVLGRTIGELAEFEVRDLAEFVRTITVPAVASVVGALADRLDAIATIGLGYLSLSRHTTTLSGGESQRIKIVRHLNSSLTSMTYVIDEPTVGLHPTDIDAMIELLCRLRDAGNSVIVVEHDPAVMAHADHLIELGPDAGRAGGHIVFEGTYDALQNTDTRTGTALARPSPVPRTPRTPNGQLTISSASRNNLRDVTVDIPTGVLTVFSGVAGSGKTSLAHELAEQHPVTFIDQKPVSTNRRSTPITYTGIATNIRTLFARHTGAPASLFSANSDGACPTCNGAGIIYTDLAFLPANETTCDDCHGQRFNPEALSHDLDGLTIADVDGLTVDQAVQQLPNRAIATALGHLADVGLGYLTLGQPLSTVSGGEAQRLRIARELQTTDTPATYVLDEPTTGLHITDIDDHLAVLDQLVEQQHTVIVVEHHLDVIRHADWLIDLGPGAGNDGGNVLYQGHPTGYHTSTNPTSRALARP